MRLTAPASCRLEDRLDVGVEFDAGELAREFPTLTLDATIESEDGLVWRGEQPVRLGADGTPTVVGEREDRQWTWASAAEQVASAAVPSSLEKAERHSFAASLAPFEIAFSLSGRDGTLARATTAILRLPDGVRREEVATDGLVGSLFLPPGPGTFPAVIVLSGSDGGRHELTAARLAGEGFATLALAYFGENGVPSELVGIELRYFERAFGWLLAREEVAGDRVRVVGTSRGGELVLLLASRFPVVATAIAYVPSGIVHSGIFTDPPTWLSDVPSWLMDGEPVPYLGHERGERTLEDPIACSPVYAADLWPYGPVERAAIPVEKAEASLLLLSGTDDDVWPSTLFSELVMARLKRHPHPVRHLAFRGAGHRFVFPKVPAGVTVSVHPQVNERLRLGGNAADNTRAARLGHEALLHALRDEWDAIGEEVMA